ncbi:MAG: hypothetical protein ACK5LK_00825, partial [Chthoniobacterales bacterium]
DIPQASKSDTPNLWLLLNILGLDAAIIAVVWQEIFALQWQVRLGWPEHLVLFFVVWAIYLFDRWMDGYRLSKQAVEIQAHAPARHQSAMRHPIVHIAGTFMLLLAAAYISLFYLSLLTLVKAIPVVVMCVFYFGWLCLRGKNTPEMFKKCLSVSIIFTLGITCAPLSLLFFVPTGMMFSLVLLCLVMNANSFAIAREEARLTHRENKEKFLSPEKWIIPGILGSLLFAYFYDPLGILPWACLLSQISIFAITLLRKNITPEIATSGFETALIVPVCLLFFYYYC